MVGIVRFLALALIVTLAGGLSTESSAAERAHRAALKGSLPRIVTFQPGTPLKARRALIEEAGGVVVKELPLIDGLLVKFKKFSPNGGGLSPKAMKKVEFVEIDEYRIWIEASPAPMSSIALPSAGAALKRAAAGKEPIPEAVPRRVLAEEPEEERATEVPWGVERVHAPAVWQYVTGDGVKVAVIDTGIDGGHPDLSANYAGGANTVDPEAPPTDDHGHGTHVAGTIAAVSNEVGVVGVAPHAKLYAVKVLDANGGGSFSTIIDGINWCVENGVHIANMSLGGPHSDVMHKAVRRAYEAGLTIVAASGNNPRAAVSSPARYPETIAVSASTSEDDLAGFSTTGEEIDFIAPGHEILSTWPDSQLAKLSGTSMASPHIAGLAALAYEAGATTPESIRRALSKAAVPIEGLDGTQQGRGLPRVDRWLR